MAPIGQDPAANDTAKRELRMNSIVSQPQPAFRFWVILLGAAVSLYLLVFSLTSSQSALPLVLSALANGASLTLLSAAVFHLAGYAPSRLPWQLAWHALFACGFVVLWMIAITVFDTALQWLVSGDWNFWWFGGPALTWQVFQGLCVYALIVFASNYSRLSALHRIAASRKTSAGAPLAAPKLILVQQDSGLVPVDPEHILAVEATGDYVRLIRTGGALLVKMTLTEAEKRLGISGFLRVHRSWLVRVSAVRLFEPLGQGRWRALLLNGEEVPVSRTGAKLIKTLVL